MARCDVRRMPTKVVVVYVNLQTGEEWNCGENRPDTPVGMILDWVAAEAAPGDTVHLDGTPILQKFEAVRA